MTPIATYPAPTAPFSGPVFLGLIVLAVVVGFMWLSDKRY